MSKKEMIAYYEKMEKKLAAYGLAFSTMSYDQATIAPVKGKKAANELMGELYNDYYQILQSDKYYQVVKVLYEHKDDLDPVLARKVSLTYRDLAAIKNVPLNELVSFEKARANAQVNWEKAKEANDYRLFADDLATVIKWKKKFCAYRNPDMAAYDILLDDFQEEMSMAKYDEFFDLIKKELVPLIKIVNQKQAEIDDAFLNQEFAVEKQKEVTEFLRTYLDFDKSYGYIGTSVHPFTDGFTTNDVRITTNYDAKQLVSNIFSVIHEIGHATYEHQVDEAYEYSKIHTGISMAVHESQSRLFENNLGRSKAFWVNNYPKLQKIFSKELNNISLEQFYRAINRSRSSLIRTEADELTYPIHILIRYELEKGIFDGSIKVEDLKEAWNQKYYDLLGVKVVDDKDGILQDVHWSGGDFGYFPTYALGSSFACQFMHQMEKDLDVFEVLMGENIKPINTWLKTNIHQYGALYPADTLMKKVTNQAVDPSYYVNYLKNKYMNLYNIKL